jgi:hypothetical protein
MRHVAIVSASAAVALAALALPHAEARIFAQWVQLGPDGTSSARAITDEASCPSVTFDGTSVAMTVRSAPEQTFGNVKEAKFPVRGCEAAVPPGTREATLDGKSLPLPKPNPQRIMMFGDTGCRVVGSFTQNCNDPNDWPLEKIIGHAAAAKPDLVIHVGDYHYRETACPIDRTGCAGSPWGYGFEAWYVDFFGPAAPLLATSPWVMVRGNHEDCGRAGEGWFRFLDRAPMEATCRDLTGIFVARQGDLGLIVVDGARAADPTDGTTTMQDLLHQQFVAVADTVPAEAWLLSHRPLNAMEGGRTADDPSFVNNTVQEKAFGPVMPAGVRMHVAGHIHLFQAVDFGGKRPPKLVVGTGGDLLELTAPMSSVGADINGLAVINSATRLGFGYMIWERDGVEWRGTLYDIDGNALDRCKLVERSLTCG